MGADCNTFDVVVGVIDRVDERYTFVHFVGMLVGSCFKARGYRHAHKMRESDAFAHSIYNYYNNVNSYCNQHPKRDDLICNEI